MGAIKKEVEFLSLLKEIKILQKMAKRKKGIEREECYKQKEEEIKKLINFFEKEKEKLDDYQMSKRIIYEENSRYSLCKITVINKSREIGVIRLPLNRVRMWKERELQFSST